MSIRNEEIFVNNYILLLPNDFYAKSKLQDVLCRPSQYFANTKIKTLTYFTINYTRKKMDHPLEHYQTITKDIFKDFDWQTTDYLIIFPCRTERDDPFFEKGFDCELFLKKNLHIFLSAMKKKI